MGVHYLALIVTNGKDFDRVYFPLLSPEETAAQAMGRWIETQVAGRKRNMDKARDQARARVESYRIARPTSWYRENELGAFAPAKPRATTRRRRR